jgi:hypothetical protein
MVFSDGYKPTATSTERGKISSQVYVLVKDCENYRDELSKDRMKANEYFDGEMKDTPADANRSQVVSRDTRSDRSRRQSLRSSASSSATIRLSNMSR